ncbi:MAG TPA: GNAT family N-acetyltransferase [Acidimicrobiales bacterium]|nr:GNAT family N-acetyltransferase [Acidimicrobiales bacterium]
MGDADYEEIRRCIASGTARLEVRALSPDHLVAITWSGNPTHIENVARQLERVPSGEVQYLAVFVDGEPVSKGGVDFAKEPGAGTIWQLATHPRLEGLGLATTLIGELELRAAQRGITNLRLGVEPDNERALRLYEHLGYRRIGESEASWEAERSDGSRFLHTTRIAEMSKPA